MSTVPAQLTTAPADRAAGKVAGDQLVEQWDFCEVTLRGPSTGNPFIEVELGARFTDGKHHVDVTGFYDGDGLYRVRFMPQTPGRWTYETRSNVAALDGETGAFLCVPALAEAGNHGPVRVRNTFHFAYADGTAYYPFGTTCYCWNHQGDALEEQTLATLEQSPFNKLRMCVFPKRYSFNENEPPRYPYEGTPPTRRGSSGAMMTENGANGNGNGNGQYAAPSGAKWDTTRFNPAFFRHLETRLRQLRDMGIEADLILFHPYDLGHWGFDRMDELSDDLYLRYVVARLSAFRNVWWSMANEFDFMKEKTPRDWDRYFQIVQKSDPYDHLRSVHNGKTIYDHNKPWVTHASIQNGMAVADFGRAVLYRDVYYKPIVFDEVKYEGDIEQRWGNISGEEMVHRMWQGTISGTYVGHGETYQRPDDVLWWSKGGTLRGTSPARIAFLRQIVETGPARGLNPIDKWDDPSVAGEPGEYYLIYFGKNKPTEWTFDLYKEGLENGMEFAAEVIDTWNMTVTPVEQTFRVVVDSKYRAHAVGNPKVELPGKPWMALRLKRVG